MLSDEVYRIEAEKIINIAVASFRFMSSCFDE